MSTLRTVSMALPRVSMARIPIVALTNGHVPHAHSVHPSGYSSMSSRSSWSNAAKKTADKLEQSAKSLSGNNKKKKQEDHMREVKQYDNPEDEVLMNLGLAMSCNNHHDSPNHQFQNHHQHHNQSGGKGQASGPKVAGDTSHLHSGSTFEQSLVDQVQADVLHPSVKNKEHQQELVSTLCQQLKVEKQARQDSGMSQHASDAIRMVESRSVLKRDNAPVHALNEEDYSNKSTTSSARSHKSK
ncbi:hypothetical protein BGZ83_009834 [Gryganskiella cystojenkinii]|nr:hypothetical protein BGZ83_009834 [Gryganskiella cystojenkinii]